jgi:hypothetical protein
MHISKGYNDKKMTHTMIPGPINSWSKSLLRYKSKPKVMDDVVVDKKNPMKEKNGGPSKAMLKSMLLSLLHV